MERKPWQSPANIPKSQCHHLEHLGTGPPPSPKLVFWGWSTSLGVKYQVQSAWLVLVQAASEEHYQKYLKSCMPLTVIK